MQKLVLSYFLIRSRISFWISSGFFKAKKQASAPFDKPNFLSKSLYPKTFSSKLFDIFTSEILSNGMIIEL